ncbi:MAG: hypothetical protein FWD14_04580 [Treponema sp.]|nr:hypothetical protein [Treponema sp.]
MQQRINRKSGYFNRPGKKSPIMIVTNVDEETKTVEVTWLDSNNSVNTAAFPSKALEKADAQPKQTTVVKKPAAKKKK